jgi:hypothetical protein
MSSTEYNPRRRLRTDDAAKYVCLSPGTLRKFRCVGGGPLYEKSGARVVVYAVEELERWLAERRRAHTSDPGTRTAAA